MFVFRKSDVLCIPVTPVSGFSLLPYNGESPYLFFSNILLIQPVTASLPPKANDFRCPVPQANISNLTERTQMDDLLLQQESMSKCFARNYAISEHYELPIFRLIFWFLKSSAGEIS